MLRAFSTDTDELIWERPLDPYLSNPVIVPQGAEVYVDFDAASSEASTVSEIRQIIAEFDALDSRKQRAVNVYELVERFRQCVA